MKRLLISIGIIIVGVFLIVLNIKNVKNADYDTIRDANSITISDNQGKIITYMDPDNLMAIRSMIYDVYYLTWNAWDKNCDYEITFGNVYEEEELYHLNVGWTTFNDKEISNWMEEQLNYEEDLLLSDLLDGRMPKGIEVWSGLDGNEVIYTEASEISEFVEIVSDEAFVYHNLTEGMSSGCDMAITMNMGDETIHFVYFGGPFQIFEDGLLYELKDPYLNAKDLHDYTGLVTPIGYNLD